jgi:hypothetical protein
MEIQITVAAYKAAKEDMGDLLPTLFTSRKKPGDALVLPIHDLDVEGLAALSKHLKAHKDDSHGQIHKLVKVLRDDANKKVEDLQQLPLMLKNFLRKQEVRMLHSLHADLRGVAYLPIDVTYTKAEPPTRGYGGREAYVTFEYGYNTKNGYATDSITFNARHCHMTVAELLRKHNLVVPDETMHEDYLKVKAKYVKYSDMHTEMFECRGKASLADGGRWWKAEERDMNVFGKPSKAVLDTDYIADSENRRYRSYREYAKNMVFSPCYGESCAVPTHPVLPVFSLIHHETVWVNVSNMREYKYDEEVQHKIVLPASHRRLIKSLVSDLDALRDEEDVSESSKQSKIMKAKSSSSIILNYGPPGTGKTLAAEVYAETIKRPLYEVQCAQIGSDMSSIESNLRDVLARSLRLKMPLVINEADAFVRTRSGNPVTDNVVAVFLRLLEYHTGLVFLTSNLGGDIDDAIKSRCIAMIEFSTPDTPERKKLWEVQLEQFNLELNAQDVMRLVRLFPKIVGRDIQNLIKLTHRVCKSQGTKFSVEELAANAVFRGIKIATPKEIAEAIEADKLRRAERKNAKKMREGK